MKSESAKSKKLGGKIWFNLVLFGLMGQIAWNVENMYFNTFLCNSIYGSASKTAVENSVDVTRAVALMVSLSAVTAVVTSFLMGNLSDKKNNRRLFISVGYILWGLVTACFGFVSLANTSALFNLSDEAAVLTVTVWIIIALDCVMTFMGSTSNDSAFNAWVTDVTDVSNRTNVETVSDVSLEVTKIIEKHDTVDWQKNKDIHNKIAQDIDDYFYELEKTRGLKIDFDTIDKIIENVITVALRRFK